MYVILHRAVYVSKLRKRASLKLTSKSAYEMKLASKDAFKLASELASRYVKGMMVEGRRESFLHFVTLFPSI